MRVIFATALALCVPALALAGEHEGKHRATPPLQPQYVQECGSCHVPFAPRLLPAASWRELMGGLTRHFGSDASLDPPTTAAIASWLEANAGTSRRAGSAPPQNRITRSAWFHHEHDRIAPQVWQRPAVKSPSNCAACHAGAEKGAFNEHDVRIPR